MLLNYIVPAAVPTAITVVPSTVAAGVIGTPIFLNVTYQGKNITTRATYTTEDEAKALVTPHGIIIPTGAGEVDITVHYPGSAADVIVTVTVP